MGARHEGNCFLDFEPDVSRGDVWELGKVKEEQVKRERGETMLSLPFLHLFLSLCLSPAVSHKPLGLLYQSGPKPLLLRRENIHVEFLLCEFVADRNGNSF